MLQQRSTQSPQQAKQQLNKLLLDVENKANLSQNQIAPQYLCSLLENIKLLKTKIDSLENYIQQLAQQQNKAESEFLFECRIQTEQNFKNNSTELFNNHQLLLQDMEKCLIDLKNNIEDIKQKDMNIIGLDEPEQDIHQFQVDMTTSSIVLTKNYQSICIRCQNTIKGKRLQTSCMHDYHLECFEEMIEHLITNQGITEVTCYCKQHLSSKILQQLSLSKSINFQEKLYQNQLNAIKKKLDNQFLTQKCPSRNCNYFCINLTGENSICQNCNN